MHSICVIIPAYGATPHLARVLEAIESGTLRPQSLVISHSGTGNPGPELAHLFPNVRFLHSDTRLLAGKARNRAAATASEDILAFCDSDVLPSTDWLERLIEALLGAQRRFVVGAVGMARTGGYWGTTGWLCEFSEQAPWRTAGEQAGGASCNMAVRRTDFHLAGGFPEDHLVGEDTLLFATLRRLGLQQWFEPTARVGHFNVAGLAAMARHQWMHGRHFALLRMKTDLPGSRLVRGRWLALLLPVAKLLRILARLLEGRGREWRWALLYLPGLAVGVGLWGGGLIAGLFTRARQPSD